MRLSPQTMSGQHNSASSTRVGLNKPQRPMVQVLVLLGAFLGSVVLGWLVAAIVGGVSENAQLVVHVPYLMVLFLGYGLWSTRLKAITMRHVSAGLLRALWSLLARRKCPQNLADVMPDQAALEQMALEAQQACSSFTTVAWPLARLVVLAASCLVWERLLNRLARLGYLPSLEEE